LSVSIFWRKAEEAKSIDALLTSRIDPLVFIGPFLSMLGVRTPNPALGEGGGTLLDVRRTPNAAVGEGGTAQLDVRRTPDPALGEGGRPPLDVREPNPPLDVHEPNPPLGALVGGGNAFVGEGGGRVMGPATATLSTSTGTMVEPRGGGLRDLSLKAMSMFFGLPPKLARGFFASTCAQSRALWLLPTSDPAVPSFIFAPS